MSVQNVVGDILGEMVQIWNRSNYSKIIIKETKCKKNEMRKKLEHKMASPAKW